MTMNSSLVTIPNIQLALDDLLNAIRQLDEPARRQIAKALLETEMDSKLSQLIEQLVTRAPADDVSDADINAEIAVVRESQP
jgi:hypothetical protein